MNLSPYIRQDQVSPPLSIIWFLGAIGGVFEVMWFTVNFFLSPFLDFCFELKVLRRLFVARTQDDHILLGRKKRKVIVNGKRKEVRFDIDPQDKNYLEVQEA